MSDQTDDPPTGDDATIRALAQLLQAAEDKPDNSPEVEALGAMCDVLMERAMTGMAS